MATKVCITLHMWLQVHELVTELKQRLEKFNLVKVQPRSERLPHKVRMEEPGELSPKDSLFLKVHHHALPAFPCLHVM